MNKASMREGRTLKRLKFLKAGLESADVPLTLLENLKLFQRDKKDYVKYETFYPDINWLLHAFQEGEVSQSNCYNCFNLVPPSIPRPVRSLLSEPEKK